MRHVDTHCHLDRYERPTDVLTRAEAAGVVMVAVTELPSGFQRLKVRLGKRVLVRPALGLHPMKAATASPLEQALFARLLGETDYVGEVGLDGSREGKPTLRAQAKAFTRVLAQPGIQHKILTVHSRGAEQQTIEALSAAGVHGILHWYSGALRHIEPALAAGLRFSVNSSMLRSKNGQRIIAELPHDRVLTETDGPYTKVGAKTAEPSDIPTVIAGLARIWGEEPGQVRDVVFENMATLAAEAKSASPKSASPVS
jgi:TatD DNase family protein